MADTANQSQVSLDSAFVQHTVSEVLAVVGVIVDLPRSAKRNRRELFRVLDTFPAETQACIRAAALDKPGSKRKATADTRRPQKRRRLDPEPPVAVADVPMDVDDASTLISGPFLNPPTEEQERAYRTGNAALIKHVCMVCARKLFAEFMVTMEAQAIPNSRHLIPMYAHPAHRLTNGWLLHVEAMEAGQTYICVDCKSKLLMDERPAYALSNGMWIGSRPFELMVLTLPERLLIALYFPAVYVVKLYPKVKGARFWDKRTVNSGLKGNVSTYRLNISDIADIVEGVPKSLPPSPKILAATIGVTFVGKGNKPLSVLPDFLKVRRQRVFEALVWLKANNPLYQLVNIAEDQLSLLPENGVPEEILVNTRISEDVNGLEREHAGYVPTDAADEEAPSRGFDGDGDETNFQNLGAAAGVALVIDDDMGDGDGCQEDEDEFGAAVFPLHSHGVIDVHADGVPDVDISAHGFANAANEQGPSNFKIRRDSAFVNEYARVDAHGQRFDGGPGNPNHMLGAFPVLFPYGKGRFEVDRDVPVPYESHVRWALQYADDRFRKDLYFIFQAFGVVQKREVCRSAGVQVKRSTFIANQVAL
ncbi:hypothetical protein B0H11DRAFT_2218604 [Mycena galericulata]|nr:hypothetical protein B0H11DRAFT_2218604 [Mycena galericulata]